MGNPATQAERVINADPDAWYHSDGVRQQMGEAIHDPATVHAMCEDYRAGLGNDRQHDDIDLAAEHCLSSPVLVVWATRDDMERLYGDPARVWRRWAADVPMGPIASPHIAEEAPTELAAALGGFLHA
jgi:haloacetate dehalogenase